MIIVKLLVEIVKSCRGMLHKFAMLLLDLAIIVFCLGYLLQSFGG
jgi:membrane protein required for beta-lactamase induction